MARPTKCVVDLNVLKENFHAIQNRVNGKKILALVKADAYGHGLIQASKALMSAGVDYLGVATVNEAKAIRDAGIKTPVLCVGVLTCGDEKICVQYDVEQTVSSVEDVLRLENEGEKQNRAVKLHIKIETGMHRTGVRVCEELEKVLNTIKSSRCVKLAGIFTHFSMSDCDKEYTHQQAMQFNSAIKQVKDAGFSDFISHCSNSAAILDYPELNYDMVRAGIILYGYYPSEICSKSVSVRPVLSLKTKIVAVNKVLKGEKIGYGGTFEAKRDMLVAVLPIGYGDGYKRAVSNKGFVLINGKKANVVGNVCMDMTMVDVTDISATVGDEVVVLGNQGSESVTADDIAAWCDTINYEIMLSILPRVPKEYV